MVEHLFSDANLLLARVWALKVFWALLLLLAGWLLAGWIAGRVHAGLNRARVEPTLAGFLAGLVRWALIVTATVTALGQLGVQTTSFAALIASAGLAMALAFQGTLSSF